jgi:hypothetical protein
MGSRREVVMTVWGNLCFEYCYADKVKAEETCITHGRADKSDGILFDNLKIERTSWKM